MSSEGNLFTPAYTTSCLCAAREHKDFVLGFIAQRNLNKSDKNDEFLVFTPGIAFAADEDGKGSARGGGDGKGQRWRGPYEVMREGGADVVIVGRGVLEARDRVGEAERYRREAWRGYEERVDAAGKGKGKR